MELRVEPALMWRQMYHEVWRIQRDFFYDPHHHGLDLSKVEEKYEPYLAGIASREDLNYLLEESLGEMTVGHMFVGGGERPEPKKFKGGLLGADYAVENGRYRVARVYSGENWNPGLQAPLTQPGVNVRPGEYILSVAGRELRATDNIEAFFEQTAGRQISLKVGPNPDGTGARMVTSGEGRKQGLVFRVSRAFEEPLPGAAAPAAGRMRPSAQTAGAGYSNFNRYYFAQVGKRRQSSTSASTKAASWRTTSSTISAARS
jgi:tricorn protease